VGFPLVTVVLAVPFVVELPAATYVTGVVVATTQASDVVALAKLAPDVVSVIVDMFVFAMTIGVVVVDVEDGADFSAMLVPLVAVVAAATL